MIDPNYLYLYCNAITTHCGAYKEHMIDQYSSANATIERMAEQYRNDSKIKRDVDSWLIDDNQLVVNMAEAIYIKALHPELCFSEQYDFGSFQRISGELEILGISPWNDFHIFRTINRSNIANADSISVPLIGNSSGQ